MELALVTNAESGRGVDASALARRLEANGARVTEIVRAPDAVTAGSAQRLAVAAGDGLVAPCAARAGELRVPLAVLPVGTANDFARDHGIPRDLDAACRLAARGSRVRRLELARMDGRPFVNVASAGLAPVAARRARPLKRALGPLAYAAGAVAAGLTSPPIACTAWVDGSEVFSGRAWQLTVASGGAFGGGADLEEADPGDGRLDLVVVPAGGRAALPRRAWGMRRGTLASQPGVLHHRGGEVRVRVEAGTPFNVDGELVQPETAPTFRARAAAFELVVPDA